MLRFIFYDSLKEFRIFNLFFQSCLLFKRLRFISVSAGTASSLKIQNNNINLISIAKSKKKGVTPQNESMATALNESTPN